MKLKKIMLALLMLALCSATIPAQEEIRWIGGYPGEECNWNQPLNWDLHRIPGPDDVVVIAHMSGDKGCYPVIDTILDGILGLVMSPEVMLEVRAGGHLLINSGQGASLGILNEGQLRNNGLITIVDPAGDPVSGEPEHFCGAGNMYLIDSSREVRMRICPHWYLSNRAYAER